MIKAAKTILAPILCNLFNEILRLQYFPKAWSKGIIIPIFKAGDVDDPDNYRGICLNSAISKLFTGILNVRLTEFLNASSIIAPNPTGFRKNFRTADNAFTLKTLIENAFSQKQKLYTCFVDFYKILKNGISPKFFNLTNSMYSSITAQIALPNGVYKCFRLILE